MTATTTTATERYEWARHRSRGELLDLVLGIEERLRKVVRSVLQDEAFALGTNGGWEALIADSIRTAIAAMTRSPAHADLLDRATLHQLFMIVLNRWDLFGPLFGDRSQFHAEADRFRGWRNQLAHGLQPSSGEKVELASSLGRLGRRLDFSVDPATLPTSSVLGTAVLWVDDRPEQNLRERQILRLLGIKVVPTLDNEEALAATRAQRFDLVISDIDRGEAERGDRLPQRLAEAGETMPVVFYVGVVDRDLGTPPGAVSIHDEPAALLREVLNFLGRA